MQRRYSITVDDKRKTSNKNKVNFTNWAKIKSKNYTRLTKWPCLPHEMAKISSWEMTRFETYATKSLELPLIMTIPIMLIIENIQKYFVSMGDTQIWS